MSSTGRGLDPFPSPLALPPPHPRGGRPGAEGVFGMGRARGRLFEPERRPVAAPWDASASARGDPVAPAVAQRLRDARRLPMCAASRSMSPLRRSAFGPRVSGRPGRPFRAAVRPSLLQEAHSRPAPGLGGCFPGGQGGWPASRPPAPPAAAQRVAFAFAFARRDAVAPVEADFARDKAAPQWAPPPLHVAAPPHGPRLSPRSETPFRAALRPSLRRQARSRLAMLRRARPAPPCGRPSPAPPLRPPGRPKTCASPLRPCRARAILPSPRKGVSHG